MKNNIGRCAIAAVAIGCAGGAWFVGAGTALAPTPVQLTATLSATSSATATGVYMSKTPTTVYYWPASYTINSGRVAGQPCSSVGLQAGDMTNQVIVTSADAAKYAKCASPGRSNPPTTATTFNADR
jgi:hypothetical protein